MRDFRARQRVRAVGARRVHTLLECRLLRFRGLSLRLRLLQRGLRLGDLCLGRVVALRERSLRGIELCLSLIGRRLHLLNVGWPTALQVVERGVSRGNGRLGRRHTARQRVNLALRSLQVGGIVAAEGRVRRLGAGQR